VRVSVQVVQRFPSVSEMILWRRWRGEQRVRQERIERGVFSPVRRHGSGFAPMVRAGLSAARSREHSLKEGEAKARGRHFILAVYAI